MGRPLWQDRVNLMRATARLGRHVLAVTMWLVALPLSGCAYLIGARALSETARAGHTSFHTMRVGERQRSFLLHLPPHYRAGAGVPLVLAFHGHTGNANVQMDISKLNSAADSLGYAVAYPNGTGTLRYAILTWNAATCCGSAEADQVDDIAFARALVDTLVAAGLVARHDVFATGFSAGGMMALRLACQSTPFVRGAADVAGAMPDTTCRPGRRLPILLVRGDEDEELAADHLFHRQRSSRARAFALSFEGAREFWARHNGCAATSTVLATPVVETVTANACPSGATVREEIVHGESHAWPGGERSWRWAPTPTRGFDASREILRFFAEQRAVDPSAN